MNGYGSQWEMTASELSAIQKTTATVCPMMYFGVPKNLAARSAHWPNLSGPNAPWASAGTLTARGYGPLPTEPMSRARRSTRDPRPLRPPEPAPAAGAERADRGRRRDRSGADRRAPLARRRGAADGERPDPRRPGGLRALPERGRRLHPLPAAELPRRARPRAARGRGRGAAQAPGHNREPARRFPRLRARARRFPRAPARRRRRRPWGAARRRPRRRAP